ncbi:orotidine-5'-phosphate decarboxylase [Candidatus Bipolaricaulota bacterium]|nr:orotidine-5'-phosphate decarboxylase [Candidatus Bipolaricaulota bacterium]
MNNFKRKISTRSDGVNSQLIFALDLSLSLYSLSKKKRKEKREQLYHQALSTLRSVENHVAAVKINYPLLLSLGPDLTADILDEVDILGIADFKVADIDNTSRWIGKQAMEMGFGAIIAHPFVGFEKGLSGLFEEVHDHKGGVVLVINMSHPGSKQFITPNAEKLADFARERDADGVIAPATRPEEVEQARSWVGSDVLLLTPGIGAQGGKPGDAIAAGADYEIVGRAIYQAEDPGESAENIKEQINRVGT